MEKNQLCRVGGYYSEIVVHFISPPRALQSSWINQWLVSVNFKTSAFKLSINLRVSLWELCVQVFILVWIHSKNSSWIIMNYDHTGRRYGHNLKRIVPIPRIRSVDQWQEGYTRSPPLCSVMNIYNEGFLPLKLMMIIRPIERGQSAPKGTHAEPFLIPSTHNSRFK